MMSAELLREAATKMRERAENALESIDNVLDDVLGDDATGLDGTWTEMVNHIAAWSPAVALAVADWLDAIAARAEEIKSNFPALSRVAVTVSANNVTGWDEAMAVARAYLGRPE